MCKKVKIYLGLVAFLIVGVVTVFITPTARIYANDAINVTIDGVPVVFIGQTPTIVDGRTLVPVRGVFEQLGFDVNWNQDLQQATLTRDSDTVVITADRDVFTANGESHRLDVPAQIINGRTMLPIRAVLTSVGYYMVWDGDTRTVIILSERRVPSEPSEMERQLAAIAAIERSLRESGNTLARMQGFEGDYVLGNPTEIMEIIVRFVTPPEVRLRQMYESGNPFDGAQSYASFEEQALAAHSRFHEQLSQLPIPSGLTAPEIFSEHHRLLNGVYMRVSVGMVRIIAFLPEVSVVEPHIIPAMDIPITTDTGRMPLPVDMQPPPPPIKNPN